MLETILSVPIHKFRPWPVGEAVRQGVDPVTAAKAGRWSDPNLPMRIYAHEETDAADIRALFRTNHVQDDAVQTPNSKKARKE